MNFLIKFISLNEAVEVTTEKEVTKTIKNKYPDAYFDPTMSSFQRLWFAYNPIKKDEFLLETPTIVAVITMYN